MADYTFEELKHKTVAELREIAAGIDHDAVKGYSQLRKDKIIEGICTALGIDMHAHHEIVGLDKRTIKAKIRELKKQRDAALEAHDSKELKQARRAIHRLKRRMRRAMV